MKQKLILFVILLCACFSLKADSLSFADENGEIWVGGYDTIGNEGIGILADEGTF